MSHRSAALVLSIAGLAIAAACGGGASAQSPTTTPAVATLPAQSTTAAATLPPQTAAPTTAATATPAATRTTAATATAASTATSTSASLVTQGKLLFTTFGPSGKGCQECHGADGKGSTATDGTTAPNIRGTTEVKLRNALAGGAALMTNLKLTDAQIDAVLAYLAYLDQQ